MAPSGRVPLRRAIRVAIQQRDGAFAEPVCRATATHTMSAVRWVYAVRGNQALIKEIDVFGWSETDGLGTHPCGPFSVNAKHVWIDGHDYSRSLVCAVLAVPPHVGAAPSRLSPRVRCVFATGTTRTCRSGPSMSQPRRTVGATPKISCTLRSVEPWLYRMLFE